LTEREQLSAELRKQQSALEELRTQEGKLRQDMAQFLDSLMYAAGRASHKIITRQYADGIAAIDYEWAAMKECEDSLSTCVEDIQSAVSAIEDMKNDLDDETLWAAA
jgi:FtsZ-binding cell division protein ZapB